MSKVRNIEWNETQLKIALELSKDKTAHEIIAEGQTAQFPEGFSVQHLYNEHTEVRAIANCTL